MGDTVEENQDGMTYEGSGIDIKPLNPGDGGESLSPFRIG
jgi:hypothetical protein